MTQDLEPFGFDGPGQGQKNAQNAQIAQNLEPSGLNGPGQGQKNAETASNLARLVKLARRFGSAHAQRAA